MARAPKPTPTQRAYLVNLAAGRNGSYGMPSGRSFAGGLSGTVVSLHRRRWTDANGITPAGRRAIGLEPVE